MFDREYRNYLHETIGVVEKLNIINLLHPTKDEELDSSSLSSK